MRAHPPAVRGHGREVGLDEDVVDRRGQVRRHRGGNLVEWPCPQTRRAARRARPGEEMAPRPVTPSHSASRRTPSMATDSGPAGRRGRRQPSRSRIESVGRRARLEHGDLSEHLAADPADCGPLRVGAQGVRRRVADSRTDEVRGPGGGQPGAGDDRPTVARLAGRPLVRSGGSPDGHDLAVVADQPSGIRHLDDEGRPFRLHVEHLLGDLEVADGQATSAQDARRVRAPR